MKTNEKVLRRALEMAAHDVITARWLIAKLGADENTFIKAIRLYKKKLINRATAEIKGERK